jgi:hypothetical protein
MTIRRKKLSSDGKNGRSSYRFVLVFERRRAVGISANISISRSLHAYHLSHSTGPTRSYAIPDRIYSTKSIRGIVVDSITRYIIHGRPFITFFCLLEHHTKKKKKEKVSKSQKLFKK